MTISPDLQAAGDGGPVFAESGDLDRPDRRLAVGDHPYLRPLAMVHDGGQRDDDCGAGRRAKNDAGGHAELGGRRRVNKANARRVGAGRRVRGRRQFTNFARHDEVRLGP